MRTTSDRERAIQHPLVSGGGGRRLIRVTPLPEFRERLPESVPLPTAAEVLSGFDAVFQFSSDLLGDFAASWISYSDIEVPYLDGVLTESLDDRLRDVIYAGAAGTIVPARHYTFANDAFIVQPHSPRFRFLSDVTPDRAKFEWQLDFFLRRKETIESFTRRRGVEPETYVPGMPPGAGGGTGVSEEGWGPMGLVEQMISLGSGRLFVYASPVVATDEESLAIQIKLDHSDWVIHIESSESLLADLLALGATNLHSRIVDSVYSEFLHIAPVSGYGVMLSPVISLKPSPPLDESEFGSLRDRSLSVQSKVMPGNMPFSQVFCVGINFADTAAGDIEAAQPFVSSGNYGVAVSEEIVCSIVRSRWESAEHSFRSTIDDLEYTVSADGESHSGIGRAEVTGRFHSLDEVSLDPGPDESLPNSLRLTGEYEITLQKLILEDGSELLPEELDGDFGTPVSQPFALHILPFSAPPEPVSSAAIVDFLNQLGAHLLYSMYFPFPNRGVVLDRLAGSVHSASGVVVMNGCARH